MKFREQQIDRNPTILPPQTWCKIDCEFNDPFIPNVCLSFIRGGKYVRIVIPFLRKSSVRQIYIPSTIRNSQHLQPTATPPPPPPPSPSCHSTKTFLQRVFGAALGLKLSTREAEGLLLAHFVIGYV